MFKNRDGVNETLCLNQREFLKGNHATKDLFEVEAIVENSIASTEKYNFFKYDECLQFFHKHETFGDMNGKYCVMTYDLGEVHAKQTAVCYPGACSDSVLKSISKDILKENGAVLKDHWCQSTEMEITPVDYFSFAFFGMLIMIVLISTIYDFIERHNEESKKFMTRFSLYSNLSKVFRARSDDMNCLYALRAISVLWLIIANRFTTMATFPLFNQATHTEWLKNFCSSFISSSDAAYDTFFMVSGFLLSTYCLKAYATRNMNFAHMLLHRYFRYIPLLIAAIIFYISIFKFTVVGPLVHIFEEKIQNCQHYWWTTVLLVENYVNPEATCLFDGWYFNVDFQFFIIIPVVVYFYYKFPKTGTFLLCAVLVGMYSGQVASIIFFDAPFDVIKPTYFPKMQSHFRCAPWIIAIFLASACMKKDVVVRDTTRFVCWMATYATFAVHFVYVFLLQHEKYAGGSIIASATFVGLHRIFWSMAIAWIIFASTKLKHGGVVQKILNSPIWRPFGKLSVSLLIVHPLYQVSTTFSLKAPYYFDSWWTFHTGMGDIFFTTLLAIFLYACIELPFILIEQSFHRKRNSEAIRGEVAAI